MILGLPPVRVSLLLGHPALILMYMWYDGWRRLPKRKD